MKSGTLSVVVSGVMVLFLAKYATSILCYDCNSQFDPRCGPEFDPFSLGVINCSLQDPPEHINYTESTFCRTIKMEIYGKIRVVRKCGYLEDNETNATCRRVTGNGDVFTTYCTCDHDLCNAAVSHRCSEMALISILMFLVAKKFLV